jgi:hypothetical protein
MIGTYNIGSTAPSIVEDNGMDVPLNGPTKRLLEQSFRLRVVMITSGEAKCFIRCDPETKSPTRLQRNLKKLLMLADPRDIERPSKSNCSMGQRN